LSCSARCMCEPRSGIPPNWNDIRTKFGYTMLYEMAGIRCEI